MPLAGSKLLGTTVLYVGPTTDTYSTGVCYTCKATESSSYYWEAVASGGEYTLTKEVVDGVIGASVEGSTAKFYNEQGAFTEVDMSGYLPLSGGTLTGTLNVGDIQADNSLSIGVGDYGGVHLSTIYMGQTNASISSRFGVSIRSSHGYIDLDSITGVRINEVKAATVDDISTHNTDATAHTNLFALKVDTETYNTAITAINAALEGKENTGVAQGLVDAHATLTASSDTLGHIKVDNETITVDENGVATAHAVGHNIFDIFYSMSSKAPAGAMDLSLGTLIASCDTVFPDFWSECVARKAEGSIRTLTEEEWQAEATSKGSCGAFVVDEDAKSIRLPKIMNMVQPGDVGVFTEAGLPNITGQSWSFMTGYGASNSDISSTSQTNGALTNHGGTSYWQMNQSGNKSYAYLYLDASKSNSIYGNSTTVQPPAVGAKLYIQVFTSAVPASMAQAGEFINMLETKADKTELDLLQPAGTVIAFAGNSAPAGYLICNGAAVNRTTYARLFAVIGTTYGEGDGSTTFNLPNLTDRVVQGSATAGTALAAGVPNITGSLPDFYAKTGQDAGAGALYYQTSISNVPAAASSVGYRGLYFDASKSNSIYGNSTTVQPPALTMIYCIKY